MKKLKIKLSRDEATALCGLIRGEINDLEFSEHIWHQRVLRAVLRQVLQKLLVKLLLPQPKYSFTLKEHEAECLKEAGLMHEIKTADPYIIALIETIKNTHIL